MFRNSKLLPAVAFGLCSGKGVPDSKVQGILASWGKHVDSLTIFTKEGGAHPNEVGPPLPLRSGACTTEPVVTPMWMLLPLHTAPNGIHSPAGSGFTYGLSHDHYSAGALQDVGRDKGCVSRSLHKRTQMQ